MKQKAFNKLKVGDRVKFVSYGENNMREKYVHTYYPELGTEGTVVEAPSSETVLVRWDSGAKFNNTGERAWWIEHDGINFVSRDIKIGDRVKYIGDDRSNGWYPPTGTTGTVIGGGGTRNSIHVAWDKGTSGDGHWFCHALNLEVVKRKPSDDDILKAGDRCIADEYLCPKCPYNGTCVGVDCEDVLLEDIHALAKRLKETNETLQKANEELRKALEAVQEELADRKKDLEVTRKVLDDTKRKLERTVDSKNAYEKRYGELLSERARWGKENAEYKTAYDSAIDKIHDLGVELDGKESIIKLMRGSEDANKAIIADLKRKLDEKESVVKVLEDIVENRKGKRTVSYYEGKITDYEILISSLKAENEALKKPKIFQSVLSPYEYFEREAALRKAKQEGAKEALERVKDEINSATYDWITPYFKFKYTIGEVYKIARGAADSRQQDIVQIIDRNIKEV